MSEATVRGVLLTHGALGMGLRDAVERVVGDVAHEALIPLSNDSLDREGIRAALEGIAGTGPVLVFTDLAAGSCAFAARTLCLKGGPRGLICGVNLPMLLEFVFHRDQPLDELIPRLVEKGREGVIAQLPGESVG